MLDGERAAVWNEKRIDRLLGAPDAQIDRSVYTNERLATCLESHALLYTRLPRAQSRILAAGMPVESPGDTADEVSAHSGRGPCEQ